MVVNERPLKRMKRRIFADLNDFFSFPATEESESTVGVHNHQQPFRDSVRVFLEKHARLVLTPSVLPCLLTWQVLLRVTDCPDPVVVVLYVVEEDVTGSTRRSVYCDQCRVVGESTRMRFKGRVRDAETSSLNQRVYVNVGALRLQWMMILKTGCIVNLKILLIFCMVLFTPMAMPTFLHLMAKKEAPSS